MITNNRQVDLVELTAAPGKKLTNGTIYADTVALPNAEAAALWREVDDPGDTQQEPDLPDYADTERAIVQAIAALATEYNAIAELGSMDITIPGLLALAESKGVPEAELVKVKSDIAMLVLDLMAKAGGTWAECWDGLKSRFAGYLG